MPIPLIIFYLFAFLAIASALMILISKKLMYNAFYLLLTLLSLAGIFIFAGADFMAVAQIMIYVGGILILLLFGVMFTKQYQVNQESTRSSYWFFGLGIATLAGISLIYVISQTNFPTTQLVEKESTVQQIGISLMTTHIFAFEIAGVLLLVALIGAILIASPKQDTPN